MAWPAVIGHDRVFERFRRSLAQGRLASTFLFVGPQGIGKRTSAMEIAKALLCESTAADQLQACETCPGCCQVAAGTHPDLVFIQKPADRNFIPVETFIGDREHRMREGLCHDIAMKPFRGGRKVAIIDDADYLNQEGANCLLKTLEEPPPGSIIILICTSEQRQLPTIRSRCQIVRFRSLSDADLLEVLLQEELFSNRDEANRAVASAQGSVTRAIEMADPELTAFRELLEEQLSRRDFNAVALSKDVQQFVDAAGSEASPRRARLRQVVSCAAMTYRQTMVRLAEKSESTDLPAFARSSEAAADCLSRCEQALWEIEANANLGTLIPCWLDDMAQRALRP
jgi:DNA polymerase-3 subunit delta'